MPYDPYASSASKNDKGSSKFLTFNWGDSNPKFYKIKEAGDHMLSFIPFIIKTRKHPDTVRPVNPAPLGAEVYALDFWKHSYVGPGQFTVICPQKTWGKPCPICELADKLIQEQGKKSKEASRLRASHRVMYNVMEADKNELMVFEESYSYFEKELISRSSIVASRKGQAFIRFASLSEGLDVRFASVRESFSEDGSSSIKFNKFASFDFERRDTPRPASLVDRALSLDEYMIQFSYEELERMLYGQEADQSEDEEYKEQQTNEATGNEEKCPHGRQFGKKFYRENPVCNDCALYVECQVAYRAANAS